MPGCVYEVLRNLGCDVAAEEVGSLRWYLRDGGGHVDVRIDKS